MNASVTNLHIKPIAGATDEALAVSTSAVQLTSANWSTHTKYIILQFQDNTVRVTFDGSTPTTSNGFAFSAGTITEWSRQLATAAKFIRESADAVVFAQEASD